MRYAIVTETWPPEVNGVALTVESLAQGLRGRGHAVDLVRPRQAGAQPANAEELLVRGAALPRYPGLRFGLPATRALLRRWRDTPPHAVYVATEGPLGWSALRAARRLSIPVASGLHTRFDSYMRDYGLAPLEPLAMAWMRRFHNRADATLVPTVELAGFLRGNGFRNVVQLARAVDTARFDPRHRDPALRAQWRVEGDGPVVIHVGRIAAEKNLALAVRAFRSIQRRDRSARFVLVGDGPEREALARANPDFVFCGMQRDEALARHFASADLFLFPSRSETFGNVTLEAMASGLAVVAFDYGAARAHLRDGVHGAAVADDAAFEAAALRLAGDAGTRRSMGAAARRAMLRLSPAQVAADFDALLRGLARQGAPDATARAA
ncbi:glycosyltransferase family 1 protein [Luteimonas sp. RD2P54]|uniref:Glycosyltransferase family 1 protein n=1 Tax=Luteimonas endophytica TaxID=3042023 RepID=A0ABT6JBJ5_9GAMM|nr:glycosyltransferase family 1 protein [Luteimonas endophytica]MDH5824134.1 glycosyltransferase family 1 protein [Luteimonas endophytica]